MAAIRDEWHQHFHDALLYGMSAGAFGAGGFHRFSRADWFQRPPLHGAIDFTRGEDGVWRLPQVGVDGDTIHFGFDPAGPDGDFTTFTFCNPMRGR